MSLDLHRIVDQIDEMAAGLRAEQQSRAESVSHALQALRRAGRSLEPLEARIESSKTSWLVAGLLEDPAKTISSPPSPPDYLAIATDGSQIDVDRHGPARCFLLNTGTAVIRYGQYPEAALYNNPTLYARREDMAINDRASNAGQSLDNALLGMKRAIAECRALAESCKNMSGELPVLALLDGTLIMWGLAGNAYPDFVREELLSRGFLASLEEIRELKKEFVLAFASYISHPRGGDVVNILRVALCPHDPPDCDRFCPRSTAPSKRECDAVSGIQDRDLFSSLLAPGERSATFSSRSSIVRKHYGANEIHFFYLKGEEEIARVEFPVWVKELDLMHALILDQCRRGQGYPVSLSEAHEQAVISGADRQRFRELLEIALSDHALEATLSEKSISKRTRWI